MLEQQQANRELIRSLAHEIKNPLGGIRGAAQLLEARARPPAAARVHAGDHRRSRPPAVAGQPAADAAPAAACQSHATSTRSGARAQRRAGRVPGDLRSAATSTPACPSSTPTPSSSCRPLLNIVRNAAQALDGRIAPEPSIRLRTRVARDVTLARKRHRLALASACRSTTGPAFPTAIRDRIFYPLVSGREGGSGLGLTIAQTFIAAAQRHHRVREHAGRPCSRSCFR